MYIYIYLYIMHKAVPMCFCFMGFLVLLRDIPGIEGVLLKGICKSLKARTGAGGD